MTFQVAPNIMQQGAQVELMLVLEVPVDQVLVVMLVGGSGCFGIDTSATQNTGSGGGSNGNIGAGGSSGAGATGIVVVNYSYNSATYAEYDLSINTGAGDIDVNGALANLGELNLTSTSAGSEISGIISTDTIVNKAGVGSLTLSSNNTYTGLTNIDVGTIIATHANALGATSAGTVVDSGAALAVSGGLTVAEPVSLSGTGVASAGALSLISGNNTYSGAITLAADTLIKSTAGTPTLSATINGGYALTTVASDALTVSGVIGGTTPLTKVNLSTTSGNLTLGNNIAVAGTGTDAMIFNAGSSTAAGTTTGGNIILSGSPTLTTGDGGRITFYTGSVSGSTGLTSLIGSGTHRFRYNSDETTTNYTATLSSGSYAIYREQPTLTVTAENEALTYGTTPTPTVTISGMQNGDANGTVVTTAASISIGGATSTSGNYTAGSHTITPSAAASTYGYGFDYDAGTLTVAQYDLTATIATVSATYGAGVDAGSVSLNQIGDDAVGVTASIVSPVYSNASKLKAGSYSQITGVTANLTGADAANYTLSATTRANSVSVAPKAITYDIAAGNITYGAADSAGSISYSALETGDVVSASAQIDDRALSTAGKLKAGTYTQSINGSHAGVDKDNYTITLGTANSYVVGKQAITVTNISASNKEYNGNTEATIDVSLASFTDLVDGDTVTVSATGTFSDKNVGTGKTVTLSETYAGTDRNNYTITSQGSTTANITAAPLTYSVAANDKTYDGDTEATATLTLAGYINTETLTETNSSTFDTKNVGSNKTVTVNSITLADGNNGGLASNYSIATGGTTTANITQLASVTWTGSAGDGLWSSATNWAGSAIPDLDNVAQAIIPEGVSTTFDTDSVTTNSDGSIGSSIANAGTLTFNGANDYTFAQVISGAGDLIKSGNNTLTLSATSTYTGDTTISAGTLKLTGNLNSATNLVIAPSATLDLQAALTAATLDLDGTISNTAGTSSLIISGTANLGANVTTTGTQTYTGAVTLSAATITLTTTNSDVTFGGTIDSDAGQTRHLTIDTNGTTGTIQFGGLVGNTVALGAIGITGNLDLDANIVGAASLAVSGSSNLGASVTTTGNQTYTGAVTLSADVTLTTTNNGDVSFSNVVDGDYDLQVSTHGTGDTTFAQAVGANTALNNITITTDEFTAAAIKADGTFSLTNLTASTISGILSETSALALTKAGVGNLTLTAVHTFTGDTTISAGDVIVGGSGQLGSGSYGGAISLASGSTLSFGSSVSQTLSGVISGDGDVEKVTSAASTLTLSGDNTYTGGTNVSAGYLQSGSSSGASPPTSGPFGTATVTVASGAVLDVNGQTVGNAINLSGTGISENGALINSHATAATISGDITLAAHTSVGGAHAVTLSGAISGTGINFTKVGASTYTLSGNNTYTGLTTISNGVIAITHNNALGTTAGTTTVASGAALHLSNNITVAEAITIGGTGISTNGAIRNVADSNTLSGLITLAADAEIQIDTGTTLALNVASGNAITGTFNLTMDSVGTSSIADPIATSTGNLTKTGAGTLTLSGTNTYTGNTTISAGTLKLTGNLNSATDLVIAPSATLDLQAALTAATLDLDGTISNTAGTSSLIISGTANLGGSITTTGTQTYTGAVTLSGGDRILQGSTVNFGGTITGTGSHDLTVTGNLDLDDAMTSVVDLSVSGTSNLGADITTTGTQTYTGVVTLSDDIALTTSGADVIFNDEVVTDYSSSSLVPEVIQFLGNGGYQYSSDGGSTYSSGTANSSETTLGEGYITFASDTYTWNFSQSSTVETLLVGGGGSGGPDLGGGGGGGGVISIPSLSITANTDYEIVVGDGGISTGDTGGQGEDTTAFGATAAGGGTSGRHQHWRRN